MDQKLARVGITQVSRKELQTMCALVDMAEHEVLAGAISLLMAETFPAAQAVVVATEQDRGYEEWFANVARTWWERRVRAEPSHEDAELSQAHRHRMLARFDMKREKDAAYLVHAFMEWMMLPGKATAPMYVPAGWRDTVERWVDELEKAERDPRITGARRDDEAVAEVDQDQRQYPQDASSGFGYDRLANQ